MRQLTFPEVDPIVLAQPKHRIEASVAIVIGGDSCGPRIRCACGEVFVRMDTGVDGTLLPEPGHARALAAFSGHALEAAS